MSAPETKAWSPAPVTTTTRTAGSFSNSSMMTGIASHMSDDVALRLAGLLKTRRPMGPSFSAIMFGVGLIMACLLDDAALAEAGDGGVVVAELLQQRCGMLAQLRCSRAHLEGRAAHVDGLADHLDLAELGRFHRMRHLEVLDLRIGEHLVHLVDRPRWHARLVELVH